MSATSDLRMDRPAKYSIEEKINLLSNMDRNRQRIKQFLLEYPEEIDVLTKMLTDVLIQYSGFDFYRMPSQTYQQLMDKMVENAKSIIQDILSQ